MALAETEQTEVKKSVVQNTTQFFREVRVELGKVTWPEWKPVSHRTELWASTLVVVVAVLLLSGFIGIADMILARFIGLVLR